MKIAIATENGSVSAHFGHCEGFTIFEVEDKNVKSEEFVQNPGHEPGFLPVFLSEKGVDLIIAGGMGERAQGLFAERNIDTIVGASGSAKNALDSYLNGDLKSNNVFCKH